MSDRPITPLRHILSEEGRKQSWLAERTGIHYSRLSLIVNGLHPSQSEAKAIAEALGRSVKAVFPPERTPA